MELTNDVGPVQEYEALRTELQESRGYVFERPLLILGAVAGITAFGAEKMTEMTEFMPLLPPLITALMIYNLWSTAWRQSNSSRIVAYIGIALEAGTRDVHRRWWGWETCLKQYREKHEGEVRRKVKEKMKNKGSAKPDPLMYWEALLLLHIGIVLLALLGSFSLIFCRGLDWPWSDWPGWLWPYWPDWLYWVGLVVNLLLMSGFVCVCCKNSPTKMGWQIECESEVWESVLDELEKEYPELPGRTE